MKIDIKNQEFLKAIYYLNKNKSNAVLDVQRDFYKLFFNSWCQFPPQYIFFDENKKTYYLNHVGNNGEIKPKFPLKGHRNKMFNDDEIAKIKELKETGKSARFIAKEMKTSHTTINKYLK